MKILFNIINKKIKNIYNQIKVVLVPIFCDVLHDY